MHLPSDSRASGLGITGAALGRNQRSSSLAVDVDSAVSSTRTSKSHSRNQTLPRNRGPSALTNDAV